MLTDRNEKETTIYFIGMGYSRCVFFPGGKHSYRKHLYPYRLLAAGRPAISRLYLLNHLAQGKPAIDKADNLADGTGIADFCTQNFRVPGFIDRRYYPIVQAFPAQKHMGK